MPVFIACMAELTTNLLNGGLEIVVSPFVSMLVMCLDLLPGGGLPHYSVFRTSFNWPVMI